MQITYMVCKSIRAHKQMKAQGGWVGFANLQNMLL